MTPEPVADATPRPDPSAALAPVGPRIYGVVDVLRADRIAGWAIDRTDSAAALDVDIAREGRLVRTVRADRHRVDLAKGEVGTGNYGFRAEIEPPLEPGFEFTVTATARAPDGATAALARVGAALRTPDPATRLLERLFEEVARLAAGRPDPAPPATDAGRLTEAIARIEVAQARIEAAIAQIEPPPAPRAGGLGLIVVGTLGVAAASLGIGLYSLWWQ